MAVLDGGYTMAKKRSRKKRTGKAKAIRIEKILVPPSEIVKHAVKKAREEHDTDDPKEAKRLYGRRWKAMRKADQRYRLRRKRNSKIEIHSYEGVMKEVLKLTLLAKGSVNTRYVTCGKKDCPCMEDKSKRHGPYYYLSLPVPKDMWGHNYPKVKHFYITEMEAMEFDKKIENYKRIQQQIWLDILDEFEGSGLDIR
jgi:hypothetical protein